MLGFTVTEHCRGILAGRVGGMRWANTKNQVHLGGNTKKLGAQWQILGFVGCAKAVPGGCGWPMKTPSIQLMRGADADHEGDEHQESSRHDHDRSHLGGKSDCKGS